MSAPAITKSEVKDKWKDLEAETEVLLREMPEYRVWLNKNLEVDWKDDDDFHDSLRTEGIDIDKIQGSITCLEAIPVDHLPRQTLRSYRSILGEAMCLAFEKDL